MTLMISTGLLKGFKARTRSHDRVFQRMPPRTMTNSTFHPFILNGRPADIYDYPFKLALHVFGNFYCSASVISSRWSLSAGNFLSTYVFLLLKILSSIFLLFF